MNIFNDISELVGKTPLLRLNRFAEGKRLGAEILAKLECFNPASSQKDRAALYMINDAEAKGLISKGSVIVEPTSGNTGIGLAAIGVSRGYRVVLTMPDTMSLERRQLLKAYGAEVVLTEGKLGMSGAIAKAEEILKNTEGSFMPSQFTNRANAEAHFKTTGPEIYEDTDGRVDIFVAGVGTGGTLTGTGEYLKSVNRDIRIVAVEPTASPMISKGVSGSHGLQGIGANFVPELLNRDIIDEVITVSDEDAFEKCRELVSTEGLLVGISSGAALKAAEELARREENRGKVIVALLPDTGERYLSTGIFG